MFTVLKSLSDAYEYISGGAGDPLCDKIAQFGNKERTYLEMEGSVGLCTIVDGKYVDKEIKDYDRIKSSSNKLSMAGKISRSFNKSSGNVVAYLGEKLLLEGDLDNEYKLQLIFYSVWEDHCRIYVPKPIFVKDNVLRMEYFDIAEWVCIENVENSFKKWEGFLLLKEFFFGSFDKYLLHGDISAYNTLINIGEEKEEVKICVLDYGLSSEISDEQMIGFNEMTDNCPHKFAEELLRKWWKNDNRCPSQYTDEWLEQLKKNFDINVIISNTQLPSESKTLELLGMFVRSILNISNMAVRYSKF